MEAEATQETETARQEPRGLAKGMGAGRRNRTGARQRARPTPTPTEKSNYHRHGSRLIHTAHTNKQEKKKTRGKMRNLRINTCGTRGKIRGCCLLRFVAARPHLKREAAFSTPEGINKFTQIHKFTKKKHIHKRQPCQGSSSPPLRLLLCGTLPLRQRSNTRHQGYHSLSGLQQTKLARLRHERLAPTDKKR